MHDRMVNDSLVFLQKITEEEIDTFQTSGLYKRSTTNT